MAKLMSVCDRLKRASATAGLVIEESLDDAGLFGPEKRQPTTVEIEEIQSEAPIQLLTQFIGPPSQPTGNGGHTSSSEMNDSSVERQETDKLRRAFLQQTETMDRANNHLESLTKATERDRIPNKLRINVKPLVVNGNNPLFQREWSEVIAESLTKLIATLQRHFSRTARAANLKIRELTEEARNRLGTVYSQEQTKTILEATLEEANKTRHENNQNRQKRKLDNQQKRSSQSNKRTKKD